MSKTWALVLFSMPTAATANGGGSEDWFCPPLRLTGIYDLGCRCPFSTGYLLPGLVNYVISKVFLTVVLSSTAPV